MSVWRRALLTGLTITSLLWFHPDAERAEADNCKGTQIRDSDCLVDENNGESVALKQIIAAVRAGDSAQVGPNNAVRELTPEERKRLWLGELRWEKEYAPPTCLTRGDCQPVIAAERQQASDVAVEDIAHFVPASPGAVAEPVDWGIVDKHTNFIMSATEHVVAGELFGFPAEVKFTPVGSQWRHSDGGAVDAETLGASWEDLGQAVFSKTPTSYRYTEKGEYTISTRVSYRAEYRVNGGAWAPVSGLVFANGPTISLRAFTAKTVLVSEDCIENPQGIGCN